VRVDWWRRHFGSTYRAPSWRIKEGLLDFWIWDGQIVPKRRWVTTIRRHVMSTKRGSHKVAGAAANRVVFAGSEVRVFKQICSC